METAIRYHVYAQWATARQVTQHARDAGARGVGLYLDVPVGVNPDGFDDWRHPALFARAAALGAPPDPLFAGGQDWSATPSQPEAERGRTATRTAERCSRTGWRPPPPCGWTT